MEKTPEGGKGDRGQCTGRSTRRDRRGGVNRRRKEKLCDRADENARGLAQRGRGAHKEPRPQTTSRAMGVLWGHRLVEPPFLGAHAPALSSG